MRGLTPEERHALLAQNWEPCDHDVIDQLARRGLVTEVARDDSGEYFDTNANGALALRLDAAARGVSR